jgi:hypothetical protein
MNIDMNMDSVVTSRGSVVGIGKVKIPRTRDFDYEIPMLSFLVIKGKEFPYISSCLHLQLDGYGSAEDLAVSDMLSNIEAFLRENFARLPLEKAWYNLKDLAHAESYNLEFWNAYRDVQYECSMRGIPTDSIDNLKKRIAQMQRRIEQLESANASLQKNLSILRDLIVDYTPIKEAA